MHVDAIHACVYDLPILSEEESRTQGNNDVICQIQKVQNGRRDFDPAVWTSFPGNKAADVSNNVPRSTDVAEFDAGLVTEV